MGDLRIGKGLAFNKEDVIVLDESPTIIFDHLSTFYPEKVKEANQKRLSQEIEQFYIQTRKRQLVESL